MIKKNQYPEFRQRQVFDLLRLFQTSQLIGLIGENGTGKTSLIQNGLIPELAGKFLGIGGREWNITTIRPGVSPLENLAAGMAELAYAESKKKLEEEYLLIQKMKDSNEGLRRACINYLHKKNGFNSVIIIDNFEDLFHLEEQSNQDLSSEWEKNKNSFIQNISKCALHADIPIYFLIILRSDFVPDIFNFRNFNDILSKSQYTIPQFRRGDFQEIIFSMLPNKSKRISNEGIDFLYSKLGKELQNLTLINLCIEKAVRISDERALKEIDLSLLLSIEISKLYEDKLEQIYNSFNDKEKKIVKTIFKQITQGRANSTFRNPISIAKLVVIAGISTDELTPVLLKLKSDLAFIFEIVVPNQERLRTEDLSYLPENTVLNIKNEHFVPHWPRLLEWIRQEKESKEFYLRLNEAAVLFEQNLTGYLRPPDLDIINLWYLEQAPDEHWANQFSGDYKKSIDYLLESKRKFQEEILQKENLQREKIKRIRKTGLYLVIATLIIALIIAVFALDAKNQENLATMALKDAKKEKERAEMAKERADLLYQEAKNAMQSAQASETFALMQQKRADDEFKLADSLRLEAENQKILIEGAFNELDIKSAQLGKTVEELKISESQKEMAKKEAESAKTYQESLNKILLLRNKLQKDEYEKSDLPQLLKEVQEAYLGYNSSSKAFKGLVLPNNDLYQVLMEVRETSTKTKGTTEQNYNLYSLPNGIRKITISSSGFLAAGGDDGILLYSKKSVEESSIELKSIKLPNERIRSLEFINQKDLIIGTVSGSLYKYLSTTDQLERIALPNKSSEIVEQLIFLNNALFMLKGKEIIKMDLQNKNTITRISEINANKIFKFNNNKLLVVSRDLELILLDSQTLQWRTINTDFKNKPISTLIASENKIFLGLENGDVIIGNISNLSNEIKVETNYTIHAHLSRITSLNYDNNTQKLFTASLDQKANIFDLSLYPLGISYISNQKIKIEGFSKWIWDFELITDSQGKNLLTVDENGDLKLWKTGMELLYNEIYKDISN